VTQITVQQDGDDTVNFLLTADLLYTFAARIYCELSDFSDAYIYLHPSFSSELVVPGFADPPRVSLVRPRHARSLHQADQRLHDLRHRRPELRLGLLTTLQQRQLAKRASETFTGWGRSAALQPTVEGGRVHVWCLPGHTARPRRRSGRGISRGTGPAAPGRPSGPARRCRAAAASPIGPATAPAAAVTCTSFRQQSASSETSTTMLLLVLHQKKSEAQTCRTVSGQSGALASRLRNCTRRSSRSTAQTWSPRVPCILSSHLIPAMQVVAV
jgi:hypothetical protein